MVAMINGINLAFDDIGSGPAVVLLHELPLCREMWRPQVNELTANGYRVITPDIRGFGESEAGYRPFSLQLCADDLAGLLHYIGVGRAVFVGLGAAAMIIAAMLQRHTHRVVGSCLISPVDVNSDARIKHCHEDFAAMTREGKRLTAIDCLCQHLLSQSRLKTTQQLAQSLQKWMEQADPAAMSSALAYLRTDVQRCTVRTPTMWIGSDDDLLTERSIRPSAKTIVETINDTGHLINLEYPEKTNQCLINFLTWLSLTRPKHHRLAIAA